MTGRINVITRNIDSLAVLVLGIQVMSGLLLLTDARSSSYPHGTNSLCILNGIQDDAIINPKNTKGRRTGVIGNAIRFPFQWTVFFLTCSLQRHCVRRARFRSHCSLSASGSAIATAVSILSSTLVPAGNSSVHSLRSCVGGRGLPQLRPQRRHRIITFDPLESVDRVHLLQLVTTGVGCEVHSSSTERRSWQMANT